MVHVDQFCCIKKAETLEGWCREEQQVMENSPLRVSFLQPFFIIRVTFFHLDENMLHHYLFKCTGIIIYRNMQTVKKNIRMEKVSFIWKRVFIANVPD